MIGAISKFFEAKKRAYEVRIQEAEAISKMIQETADIVTERPGDGGWTRMDQVSDREKGHLQPNQLEMLRKARDFYRWDPMGRPAIQTMVNYIMGQGVSISPKSEDPMVWWVWRDFWTCDRNKMELKQFEIIWRLFRDGEVFIRFYDKDDDGKSTGKTTIRFIDPLLVRNPGGDGRQAPSNFNGTTTKSGIEHDANDVERVIRYWVMSNSDSNEFYDVPAEEMLHIKIFADSDQKRGETFMQPIMKMLKQYNIWLENRILLNKMRTAIVMIKKVTGTPAQVTQMSQTLGSAANQRTGDNKKEQIRGGSVVVANPGVDYQMQSPNINASDVKDDGREMKLNIAAGLNMPEYAITGDASNANYASSLVAEAPFVKSVAYWQMFMEFWLKKLYRKVMEHAVAGGLLDAPDDKEFLRRLKRVNDLQEQEMEDDEEKESPKEKELKTLMPNGKLETPSEIFFGCDMQWPEIIHRDPKAFTESLQLARTAGWVSDQTASSALGWDFTEEVRKQKTIEDEAEKVGNPLLGIKSKQEKEHEDDGAMDAEINDVISNLTDDERKELLAKNNAQDIVNMMNAKAGGNGNGSKAPIGNQAPQGGQNGGSKTGAGVPQRTQ